MAVHQLPQPADDYDLRAAIRDHVQRHEVVDARAVANAIVDEMPETALRDALTETLPALVRIEINLERTAINAADRRDTESERLSRTPQFAVAKQPAPQPSRRWAAVAEAHAKGLLDQKVSTERGYVALRQCTIADLDHAVAMHKGRARHHGHEAAKYRRLQRAMSAAGVETVADLGEAATRSAFDAR